MSKSVLFVTIMLFCNSLLAASGFADQPSITKLEAKDGQVMHELLVQEWKNKTLNLNFENDRQKVQLMQAERVEPDGIVMSNMMIVDGDIYSVGQIEIYQIKKIAENTYKFIGSAGNQINPGPKCIFEMLEREIVIQFVKENRSSVKPVIVSTKDTLSACK